MAEAEIEGGRLRSAGNVLIGALISCAEGTVTVSGGVVGDWEGCLGGDCEDGPFCVGEEVEKGWMNECNGT